MPIILFRGMVISINVEGPNKNNRIFSSKFI